MGTRVVAYLVALTFTYYILARAEITRWLWGRFRGFLDRLARCPACSGTWLGVALSFYLPPPFYGAERWWERLLWGAAWGALLTAAGTAALIYALAVGAVHDENESEV
jgi:hypothetical protein